MGSMTRLIQSKPFEGMIELDGDSLRGLTTDDLPALMRLREATPTDVFELPGSAQELAGFLEVLAKKPWSLPMLCCHHGKPSGLCLMSVGQLKNLNAYLVALFEQPAAAERLLVLYIRQAFWAYPLHRLYVQLPSRAEVQPHIELLLRSGFRREGVMRGHIGVAGKPVDVEVLGMLRAEFDAWCATGEPRLSLV